LHTNKYILIFVSSNKQKHTTMEITVNKVEGKTNSKGSKQGRVYKIVAESKVKGFFAAVTDTEKEATIWNVNGDWSEIGIKRKNSMRFSYTTDFIITE
jgi:hypothetical protein